MCRKNQMLAIALGSFGLGLIAAVFFESMLFCGCLGIGCVVTALVLLQKK